MTLSQKDAQRSVVGKSPKNTDEGSEYALSVRNLVKTYGGGADKTRAVDGVSFDVESGSVVGLLGPNGAGKTTTIKSILGLIKPTGGSISLAGIDTIDNPSYTHEKVAAVLEGARSTYWRLTVRENLDFFSRLSGERADAHREWIADLIEQLGLEDRMDQPVNELSRGEKQKAAIATAISQNVEVLFLDEPTLGLDVESSLELQRVLTTLASQHDMTIIVSSHDMDVIESICDRVIVLNDGQVVADDSVENLLGAFRGNTYEVVVSESVSESVRSTIDREYDAVSWTELPDRTRIEVAMSDANRIHSLTGHITEAGLQIESVSTVESGFKDVFLSLAGDADGSEATERREVTA